MSQSMVHEPRDSRSIEERLALIQHHVKGLNESQMYGGVPPPPPSEQPAPIPAGCPSVAPYLAPPPGFSDSEHSLSDCDSLGSENSGGGNFQRFGFSRVSKPRSLAVPSLTDQLRKERMVTQVSQGFQTMPARKSMSGILEASPVPAGPASTWGGQKEFRTKPPSYRTT